MIPGRSGFWCPAAGHHVREPDVPRPSDGSQTALPALACGANSPLHKVAKSTPGRAPLARPPAPEINPGRASGPAKRRVADCPASVGVWSEQPSSQRCESTPGRAPLARPPPQKSTPVGPRRGGVRVFGVRLPATMSGSRTFRGQATGRRLPCQRLACGANSPLHKVAKSTPGRAPQINPGRASPNQPGRAPPPNQPRSGLAPRRARDAHASPNNAGKTVLAGRRIRDSRFALPGITRSRGAPQA
jgi:hypothetical protein